MSHVIRTLRMEKRLDSVVVEEAKESGLSINSNYNHILGKYVDSFRLISKVPCLTVPCDLVKEVLDEISEEKIKKLGKMFGSYLPKHSLFLKGEKPTVENVLTFMKTTCQDSNWYQYNSQTNNGSKKLLLRHSFGRIWSIFLREYYQAVFKEILNVRIKTELGDDSLVISLPKIETRK